MRAEDEEKKKDKSDLPMGQFQRISTIFTKYAVYRFIVKANRI